MNELRIDMSKLNNEQKEFYKTEIQNIWKLNHAMPFTDEYKNLIESIKSLEYQLKIMDENYENIEKNIFEKIYQNEKYYIKNYDCIGKYYHNQLVTAFQEYGYTSLDRINEQIQKIVEKYKNEEGNEKENE